MTLKIVKLPQARVGAVKHLSWWRRRKRRKLVGQVAFHRRRMLRFGARARHTHNAYDKQGYNLSEDLSRIEGDEALAALREFDSET